MFIHSYILIFLVTWWRHQMEKFSALLAICAGNSPVSGEFPTQRPVTRSFDVYFDLRPDKRLSKQLWGWWFETLSHSLWRHRNEYARGISGNNVNHNYACRCRSIDNGCTYIHEMLYYYTYRCIISWHIESETKWPPFCRWHFQMHFL